MKKPYRILHIAHGIPSYNNSLIEMTRRLCQSGLEVCVASHADLSQVLEGSSATFRRLESDRQLSSQLREQKATLPPCSWIRRQLLLLQMNRQSRQQSLAMSELPELVAQWQPDLLLIDMECHVAIIQLYASDQPIVLCSRWFSVFKTAGVPPMHTSLLPATRPIQSLGIALRWYRLWLYKWIIDKRHRYSRRRFWPVSYDCRARFDLACLAQENGLCLPSLSDPWHWLIPHVYRHLPVMSMTNRELELGDALDSRMHYVGPMVGQQRIADERMKAGSIAFRQFLRRSASAGNRKLVYCSFSTFWDTQATLFVDIVTLFSRRPDLNLVVGLGGRSIAAQLTALPDNVLLLEYAPQLEVLQQADAVITHGGISTINESLFHGVPLIVCSSGHVDQHGCAVRVAHHGAGFMVDAQKVDSMQLGTLLDTLFDDPDQSIQRKVAELQSIMHRQCEDHAMAAFIHQQLPPGGGTVTQPGREPELLDESK